MDLQRTADLFSQAIAIEEKHPAATNGQLDFAYVWLIEYTTANQQFPQAACICCAPKPRERLGTIGSSKSRSQT